MMHKLFISTVLLTIILSVNAQQTNTYYPSGKLESSGILINGKKEGEWKWYFENGKISIVGKFKADNEEGVWKWFHSNGVVWASGIFLGGKATGNWKRFDRNGKYLTLKYIDSLEYFSKSSYQLGEYLSSNTYIGFHHNGKREGRWKEFSNYGKLLLDCWYTNGNRNGFYKEYFEEYAYTTEGNYINGIRVGNWKWIDKSGKIIQIGNFKNGLKDGFWRELSENENLFTNGYYLDGKKNGNWIENYESDKTFKGSYKNGKYDGICTWYYANGKILSKGLYKEGVLIGDWKNYFENGSVNEVGLVKGGDQIDWKFYYENGKLKEEGSSFNGYKQGEWKEYYENGILRSTGRFKNDIQTGLWKYYHENGNLWKSGIQNSYAEDGEWKYYLSNGELDSVGNFISAIPKDTDTLIKGRLSEGIVAYAIGNKMGFMDSAGNILLSHEKGFDYLGVLPYFNEGKCMFFERLPNPQNRYFNISVHDYDYFGFINKDFKIIIPAFFPILDLFCQDFIATFTDGFSVVPSPKEPPYDFPFIIIDSIGQKVYETFTYNYGCYAACINHPIITEGIIVRNSEASTPGFLKSAYEFFELSTGRSFTIENCSLAGPFSEGLSVIEVDYEYLTFIDRSGKVVLDKKFYTVKKGSGKISDYHGGNGCDRLGGFVDGRMLVHHFENEGYGRELLSLVDKSGNIILSKPVVESVYELYDDQQFTKYHYNFK